MLTALALGTLLLAAVSPADAALGNPKGARIQAVAGPITVDVKIVNCIGLCVLTWESLGGSRLTLKCLDDGETSTSIFAQDLPQLSHPCIVESTLELHNATESVVLWRAGSCDAPECGEWPESVLPSEL